MNIVASDPECIKQTEPFYGEMIVYVLNAIDKVEIETFWIMLREFLVYSKKEIKPFAVQIL